MMTRTGKVSFVQRLAHGTMVGLCLLVAVGVCTSAVRRIARPASAEIRLVDGSELAAVISHEVSPVAGLQFIATADPAMTAPEPQDLTNPVAPAASAAAENSKVLWMEVTAYCPCSKCCGPKAHGVTASGKRVSYNQGRFVAADTRLLPFGSRLLIPGYAGDAAVEVIDRGGAIKGHRLDVFFPTHKEALQWGRRWVAVTILES